MEKYSYSELQKFTRAVFEKMGCPVAQAELATTVLLSADLRGIDSHGIARLSGYLRLWEAGRVVADPKITVVHETPSTAVVDGGSGLGLVVAPHAMEIAIEKATNVGSGWVSVKNSNHFGIAATHALMAVDNDMIGIAMTNASALVAPTFSVERMLGTNPICVAILPAAKLPLLQTLQRPRQPMANLKSCKEKMNSHPTDGYRMRVEMPRMI
jgi:LDH2 family malate/lactate/ureidoglycolate dehydrogenase